MLTSNRVFRAEFKPCFTRDILTLAATGEALKVTAWIPGGPRVFRVLIEDIRLSKDNECKYLLFTAKVLANSYEDISIPSFMMECFPLEGTGHVTF